MARKVACPPTIVRSGDPDTSRPICPRACPVSGRSPDGDDDHRHEDRVGQDQRRKQDSKHQPRRKKAQPRMNMCRPNQSHSPNTMEASQRHCHEGAEEVRHRRPLGTSDEPDALPDEERPDDHQPPDDRDRPTCPSPPRTSSTLGSEPRWPDLRSNGQHALVPSSLLPWLEAAFGQALPNGVGAVRVVLTPAREHSIASSQRRTDLRPWGPCVVHVDHNRGIEEVADRLYEGEDGGPPRDGLGLLVRKRRRSGL
jgi:hypothetical protein